MPGRTMSRCESDEKKIAPLLAGVTEKPRIAARVGIGGRSEAFELLGVHRIVCILTAGEMGADARQPQCRTAGNVIQ